KKSYTIASVKLLSFRFTCPAQDPQNPPVLGEMENGTLNLNMGPRAARRLHFNTYDEDEHFTVTRLGGTPGNEIVRVAAFGYTQTFAGVRAIVGDGGAGDDQILIDPAITAPVTLRGGTGDDILKAGGGPALIEGGIGDDQISGGPGNDTLRGGDG